ncbi:HEPN domain-containing protein [Seonamhaeicola algicola]|uniref:HEPN domain-containing protein n=1 Tax=Seonamhaeicola algicola TaxID=1719036 RepID=A0A5C7ACE7_9FLAO|nr:HEPN domain-containing protein [Seonamhaeicola algicola]TXE06111.1 HEPN domain-containing protein [Seonamhaeicola algicola]
MNEIIKWIDIAKSDVKSSKILLKNDCFSQSYFYFQQASEKANKANWMLNGLLKESELKNVGHDQFKPLRKNLISQKDNINYINSLEDKISFISENPLLKSIDITEYKDNLTTSLKFIDSIKNQEATDFEESDLKKLLESLQEIKESKLEFPTNLSEILKTSLHDYAIWLKKFNSEKTNQEADELLEILSNEEHFVDYIKLVKNLLDITLSLAYASNVFLFCSILTAKHSNSTRYPQELNGNSPLNVYNKSLEIIKKQECFLNHLDDALDRLKGISENYNYKNDEEITAIEQSIKINYTPDSTWEVFSIKSKNDFHNQFLIKKNVHSDVPEKIVKEMAIAEQLQSLSYFHYPVYGDAFSRLTRIFEMAVKSKAVELNVEIKNKSLFNLIKIISNGHSEIYKQRLDWGRKMRNMNAHPNAGTLYGSMLKLPLIRLTNIINDIFRDNDFFKNEDTYLKLLQNEYKHLLNGLWKLDNVLIHSVEILAARGKASLWAFYPVRQNYPQDDNDKLYNLEPICAILTNHTIDNGSLISKTINNAVIELKIDNTNENLEKLKFYKDLIRTANKSRKQAMEMITSQAIDYQIENFYNVIGSYIKL